MGLLTALNLLLSASSKAIIEQVFNLFFVTRAQPIDNTIIKQIRSILTLEESVTDEQIVDLRIAVLECISSALQTNNLEDLAELLQEEGTDVNPKLKQLVGQIISNLLESWKEASALGRIALPKLQDFDWALHFQRASSEIADIQIPSVLMSLTIENIPTNTHELPSRDKINFEVNRESLETMIDGLSKIRDQLQGMK